MTQILLFPDPRPLVERLGAEFFRQAPSCPGVYLMRDAAETVLYVGKARNLRKRLANYRVANPERLPRRHLRMLREVARIELRECPDELAALATESELLRALRPRFNRAGTWPGTPRFFGWRVSAEGLDLTVKGEREPGWHWQGSLGAGAFHVRATLARLLWCGLHPQRSVAALPQGWFRSRRVETMSISILETDSAGLAELETHLGDLFNGCATGFNEWIRARTLNRSHPFEVATREADLESISEFAEHAGRRRSRGGLAG